MLGPDVGMSLEVFLIALGIMALPYPLFSVYDRVIRTRDDERPGSSDS